tara:strand:+ start:143 stop:406 length:264 start_codon:yes stop_codon:yes gene_type:complete
MIDLYTAQQILNDENALILEGHESAMVAIGTRCGEPTLAVYDRDKLIESFMSKEKWDFEDAQEWVEFNIEGAWMGKETPMILNMIGE